MNLDKYEGHTPGPWKSEDVGFSAGESPWDDLDLSLEENQNLSGLPTEWVVSSSNGSLHTGELMSEADAKLIADAPLLLAEIKRLRENESELLSAISQYKELIE